MELKRGLLLVMAIFVILSCIFCVFFLSPSAVYKDFSGQIEAAWIPSSILVCIPAQQTTPFAFPSPLCIVESAIIFISVASVCLRFSLSSLSLLTLAKKNIPIQC